MRQAHLFYSILIISVLFGCKIKPNKTLVWADEFEHAGAPDSTKWTNELGDDCPDLCGWGNNEAQFYTKKWADEHIRQHV